MAHIYPKIWFDSAIVASADAQLHIGSAAVLYGLSVYTVFPILIGKDGTISLFRIDAHLKRLQNSAHLIEIELPEICLSLESLESVIRDLIRANQPTETVFARATIHVDALVPGTRSRGLHTVLSVFLYEAKSIIPQNGARLKTSVWRRNPDFSIPSRAKVNGGYVNSVLAKQDAIDSGYDDAIFLDQDGHVCELSAANIFIIRDGVLITPDRSSDILEGINRDTLIAVARDMDIYCEERTIDLSELYIADEVFACGTSAWVAYIREVDGRIIGDGTIGTITQKLKTEMQDIQSGISPRSSRYLSSL